ncbi:hypothetical protein SK128_000231 [Halocaridina rubra]|uniref:Uncharacterized protein n=1 Tax=Halocaridina rubra TaxID=373956 RepID=A0AAN9AAK6_HALRR
MIKMRRMLEKKGGKFSGIFARTIGNIALLSCQQHLPRLKLSQLFWEFLCEFPSFLVTFHLGTWSGRGLA